MTDPEQRSPTQSNNTLSQKDTPCLNEWGIPNWRNASAYGKVNSWSENRWRWEFFRRRDDLRIFFDEWAEINHRENHSANKGLKPDDPGFTAYGKEKDAGKAIRDFDYGGVPNPRIGSQPSIIIMPYSELTYHFRFYDAEKRKPSARGVLEAVGLRTAKEYHVWLEKNEMAIKFNLDEPLAKQIENAKQVLQRKQKSLHGKAIKTARHQSKWLDYLRALDAREAGASWQELADVFFADGILGREKSPEGGYRPPSPQRARDKWLSANALRFDF